MKRAQAKATKAKTTKATATPHTLTLALPRGRILEEALVLFATAGLDLSAAASYQKDQVRADAEVGRLRRSKPVLGFLQRLSP